MGNAAITPHAASALHEGFAFVHRKLNQLIVGAYLFLCLGPYLVLAALRLAEEACLVLEAARTPDSLERASVFSRV